MCTLGQSPTPSARVGTATAVAKSRRKSLYNTGGICFVYAKVIKKLQLTLYPAEKKEFRKRLLAFGTPYSQ
jgi:hypothetical protein